MERIFFLISQQNKDHDPQANMFYTMKKKPHCKTKGELLKDNHIFPIDSSFRLVFTLYINSSKFFWFFFVRIFCYFLFTLNENILLNTKDRTCVYFVTYVNKNVFRAFNEGPKDAMKFQHIALSVHISNLHLNCCVGFFVLCISVRKVLFQVTTCDVFYMTVNRRLKQAFC